MLTAAARFLDRLGVSPDVLTVVGFLLMFPAGYLILEGYLMGAAVVIALAGGIDLLDGRLARLRERRSSFGALLDSGLDRYGDAIHLLAIAIYFMVRGEIGYMLFALSALVGAFEISYVKARSEGLGHPCAVGFWQRPERLVLVILALGADNLRLVILYLGVLTHVTAFERLMYARFEMKKAMERSAGGERTLWGDDIRFCHQWPPWVRSLLLDDGKRQNHAYWLKAAFFVLTILGMRLG